MEMVVSTVTSIFTMLGSAYDFIVEKPLLLALAGVSLAAAIWSIASSIFHK